MGRVMQVAAFSLAEVTYAVGGDIGYQIQESAKQARFRVRTKQENVSGVFLPQFESYTEDSNNDFALTGLGKGGQQVQRCRETYARAVETLVELASLQTAFVILDEVIKVVNRRVNAMWVSFVIQSCASTDNQQRTCHYPPHRKHYQVHQLRARRTRPRRVLPSEEGLGQEAERCCSRGSCQTGGKGR
jgi:hypothetical protein